MEKKDIEDLAIEIVDKLIGDFTDRRGFRQQWDETDSYVRKTIIETWQRLVLEKLIDPFGDLKEQEILYNAPKPAEPKIKAVTFGRLRSGPPGTYENEKCELTAEVEENENWKDVLADLKRQVDEELNSPRFTPEEISRALSNFVQSLPVLEQMLKERRDYLGLDIPF